MPVTSPSGMSQIPEFHIAQPEEKKGFQLGKTRNIALGSGETVKVAGRVLGAQDKLGIIDERNYVVLPLANAKGKENVSRVALHINDSAEVLFGTDKAIKNDETKKKAKSDYKAAAKTLNKAEAQLKASLKSKVKEQEKFQGKLEKLLMTMKGFSEKEDFSDKDMNALIEKEDEEVAPLLQGLSGDKLEKAKELRKIGGEWRKAVAKYTQDFKNYDAACTVLHETIGSVVARLTTPSTLQPHPPTTPRVTPLAKAQAGVISSKAPDPAAVPQIKDAAEQTVEFANKANVTEKEAENLEAVTSGKPADVEKAYSTMAKILDRVPGSQTAKKILEKAQGRSTNEKRLAVMAALTMVTVGLYYLGASPKDLLVKGTDAVAKGAAAGAIMLEHIYNSLRTPGIRSYVDPESVGSSKELTTYMKGLTSGASARAVMAATFLARSMEGGLSSITGSVSDVYSRIGGGAGSFKTVPDSNTKPDSTVKEGELLTFPKIRSLDQLGQHFNESDLTAWMENADPESFDVPANIFVRGLTKLDSELVKLQQMQNAQRLLSDNQKFSQQFPTLAAIKGELPTPKDGNWASAFSALQTSVRELVSSGKAADFLKAVAEYKDNPGVVGAGVVLLLGGAAYFIESEGAKLEDKGARKVDAVIRNELTSLLTKIRFADRQQTFADFKKQQQTNQEAGRPTEMLDKLIRKDQIFVDFVQKYIKRIEHNLKTGNFSKARRFLEELQGYTAGEGAPKKKVPGESKIVPPVKTDKAKPAAAAGPSKPVAADADLVKKARQRLNVVEAELSKFKRRPKKKGNNQVRYDQLTNEAKNLREELGIKEKKSLV